MRCVLGVALALLLCTVGWCREGREVEKTFELSVPRFMVHVAYVDDSFVAELLPEETPCGFGRPMLARQEVLPSVSEEIPEMPVHRTPQENERAVAASSAVTQTTSRQSGCSGSSTTVTAGGACCSGCDCGCNGTTTTTTTITSAERAEKQEREQVVGSPTHVPGARSRGGEDRLNMMEEVLESYCNTFGFPQAASKRCEKETGDTIQATPLPPPVCETVKKFFGYFCPLCSMLHYDVVEVPQNQPCTSREGQECCPMPDQATAPSSIGERKERSTDVGRADTVDPSRHLPAGSPLHG